MLSGRCFRWSSSVSAAHLSLSLSLSLPPSFPPLSPSLPPSLARPRIFYQTGRRLPYVRAQGLYTEARDAEAVEVVLAPFVGSSDF